ncbi:hypothetical protein ACP275_04G152100 [Erythranthe tilingii]
MDSYLIFTPHPPPDHHLKPVDFPFRFTYLPITNYVKEKHQTPSNPTNYAKFFLKETTNTFIFFIASAVFRGSSSFPSVVSFGLSRMANSIFWVIENGEDLQQKRA